MSKKRLHVFILFLLMATAASHPPRGYSAPTEEFDARIAIAHAEDTIRVTYASILNAEKAGGDVSALNVELNRALDYLFDAKYAFNVKRYEFAVQNSDITSQLCDSIVKDAAIIERNAKFQNLVSPRNFGFYNISLILLIVVSSYLLWRSFKGSYNRRIMKMRPEVLNNEA